MADREKVIRGLEVCSSSWMFCLKKECPYSDNPMTCKYVLMRDALTLLKEQEARVMTLEEVIHSRDWIWYQWKNTHCGWTIAVDYDGKWIEWGDSTTDQLCKYGEKWRCWTFRPTMEQMRDTPWEKDSDAEK